MTRVFSMVAVAAFVLALVASGCSKKAASEPGSAAGAVPADAKSKMNEMYQKGGVGSAKAGAPAAK